MFGKIEKNVPLPSAGVMTRQERIAALRKMPVGSSFSLSKGDVTLVRSTVNEVHNMLKHAQVYTVRKHKGAYRCWRVS
jgi:hypothetical protein